MQQWSGADVTVDHPEIQIVHFKICLLMTGLYMRENIPIVQTVAIDEQLSEQVKLGGCALVWLALRDEERKKNSLGEI